VSVAQRRRSATQKDRRLGQRLPGDIAPGRKAIRQRGWLVRRALLATDIIGLSLAYMISRVSLPAAGSGTTAELWKAVVFVATLPAWVILAKLLGLYDSDEERTDHTTAEDIAGVFHLVTTGAWIIVLTRWVTPLQGLELKRVLVFWTAAFTLILVLRAAARTTCRRSKSYLQNTVIVGAGDIGQLVARKILRHPEYGLNLVGLVDDPPKERRPDLGDLTLLGGYDELEEVARRHEVGRVIFAFVPGQGDETVRLARRLRDLGVQIDVVPRLFELVGPRASIHSVEGLPLLGLPPARLSRSSRLLKRAADIVMASFVLVVTAPVFAYIALRIKLDSPGPIFFRQTRLGYGMREFTLLKFRTMYVDADDSAHRDYIRESMNRNIRAESNGLFKLDREGAVTRVGAWLRKTSLDELPQVINVIRGDMSLVGPRPCIPYETEHFEPHHFDRFLVPAGVTGLWQVTARAHSTFAEALDMDVAYAHGYSLGLDLRLLLRTPVRVLTGSTR
jgi:exopolysaccharide biosynthesis polyprenyl glycosylphosphotransferase